MSFWRHQIALSNLRSPNVEADTPCCARPDANYCFKALKTLNLHLTSNDDQCYFQDRLAGSFIDTLPPLESIKLGGHFKTSSFRGILCGYRASLRQLSLISALQLELSQDFVRDMAAEIGGYCRELRDLTLLVPRTRDSTYGVGSVES